MARYAAPTDFFERYDVRDIGQLASDNGSEIPESALATDANVLTALDDASGDIDTALVVSNRYLTTELEGLTGNSLAKLKRITCDLAMAYMLGRRPAADPEKLEAFEKRATTHLERLRNGENVFNLADQKSAGNPSIDGPTLVRFDDHLNLVRDRVNNYYPARRLPGNR